MKDVIAERCVAMSYHKNDSVMIAAPRASMAEVVREQVIRACGYSSGADSLECDTRCTAGYVLVRATDNERHLIVGAVPQTKGSALPADCMECLSLSSTLLLNSVWTSFVLPVSLPASFTLSPSSKRAIN